MSAEGKSAAFLRWQSVTLDDVVDDRTLAWKEKLVLLVLVRHANAFGVCWPSKRTLVEKSGLSWGAVRSAIRSLIVRRRLAKTIRATLERGNETNLFRVANAGGGEVCGTPGFVLPPSTTNPQNKKGSGSLDPLSSQLLTPTPQGVRGEGVKKGRENQPGAARAELAEAVRIVAACSDEQRSVGARLARAEFHRLSSALLAKGLELGLLVVAAEQYRAQKGPWETSRTLLHGVTAIIEDVRDWAARVERRAKRVDRAPAAPPADATVQVPLMSTADVARAARAAMTMLGSATAPKIDSRGRLASGTGISRRGQR